ncbi:MAG: hypothetical protein LBC74_16290 [Planctomycetaceae bacterium]|jgi:hypothetical protein|nr:hypothetical protein [Planctomycetaceae bacterium]
MQQKTYNEKPPLTPPRPPLAPPKVGNKKTPPREANNSPPSEGLGMVSYRLSKRSNVPGGVESSHFSDSRMPNHSLICVSVFSIGCPSFVIESF